MSMTTTIQIYLLFFTFMRFNKILSKYRKFSFLNYFSLAAVHNWVHQMSYCCVTHCNKRRGGTFNGDNEFRRFIRCYPVSQEEIYAKEVSCPGITPYFRW